jgi:hypothetical protein
MKPSMLLGLLAALVGCKSRSDVVETSELRLVDQGRLRGALAMRDGGPSLTLFDGTGHASLQATVDAKGWPRMSLSSGEASKPSAVLEVDDKGTHVLFDAQGKEQTYLFQKDDGTAGVVLGNAAGRHRGEMKLSPDGTVGVTLFGGDGGTAYSIAVARDGTVRGGR